jgi:hypothetical protein
MDGSHETERAGANIDPPDDAGEAVDAGRHADEDSAETDPGRWVDPDVPVPSGEGALGDAVDAGHAAP